MKLPTLLANPTSKLLFVPLNFTGGLPKLKLANKWEVYKISPGSNPPTNKCRWVKENQFHISIYSFTMHIISISYDIQYFYSTYK